MNHDHAQTQVDRLFTAGLSPRRHARLRDHLRECDGCRRYYEGVRALEDVMFADRGLNDAAVARMADLAVEQRHVRSRARGWLPWATAAAATAATALLVVTLVPTGPAEEIAARGAAGTGAVGLTVFHIDREAQAVRRVVRHATGAVLPVGAVVQLGVTTDDAVAHLAVLGVDERERVHWYQEPATVPAGVVDEVIGGAWRLSEPGTLRLFAVFADRPIDRATLDAAALTLRRRDLAAVERLPGVAGRQDSLLLEVRR